MKHTRITCILLAAVIVFGLPACTQKNETPKIGLCLQQTADRQALKDALTAAGYQVSVTDARNDQSKQDAQIRSFIAEEYDLLIVEPVLTSAARQIVAQSRAADIPVLFINREPAQDALEQWSSVCYIGCDPAQPGLLQGQIILQAPDRGDINGDGIVTYIVISGPEDHIDARLRTESCTAALTRSGIEVTRLAVGCGDWSQSSGKRVCEYALAQYGKDIEVVFCNNDAMALGALSAIQDGGRTVGKDIYLVGIGGDKTALELVSSGSMTGTVAADPQGHAKQVVLTVHALLNGQAVDKQQYINYVKVAQEYAETVLASLD